MINAVSQFLQMCRNIQNKFLSWAYRQTETEREGKREREKEKGGKNKTKKNSELNTGKGSALKLSVIMIDADGQLSRLHCLAGAPAETEPPVSGLKTSRSATLPRAVHALPGGA